MNLFKPIDYILYLIPKIFSLFVFYFIHHWFWLFIAFDTAQEYVVKKHKKSHDKNHGLFLILKISLYVLSIISIILLTQETVNKDILGIIFVFPFLIPENYLKYLLYNRWFKKEIYQKYLPIVQIPIILLCLYIFIVYNISLNSINGLLIFSFGLRMIISLIGKNSRLFLKIGGSITSFLWFFISIKYILLTL